MSKIGKKPIKIPEKVEVKIEGKKIIIEGPKGKIEKIFPEEISIEKKDKKILLNFSGLKEKKPLLGTWRSLIQNMVLGVEQSFEKKLKIEGIGYEAKVNGKNLVLKVGLSHALNFPIPKDVQIEVQKDIISVKGIDKEKVSQVAANIRKMRPPNPYTAKGIRYLNEVVKKKPIKKAEKL